MFVACMQECAPNKDVLAAERCSVPFYVCSLPQRVGELSSFVHQLFQSGGVLETSASLDYH